MNRLIASQWCDTSTYVSGNTYIRERDGKVSSILTIGNITLYVDDTNAVKEMIRVLNQCIEKRDELRRSIQLTMAKSE